LPLQLCIVNQSEKINLENMNSLRNSVRLVGNLGADPEIRNFDGNSKQLARFSIATTESYKNDKGERVTETQWHNMIAWGSQAKFIGTYLKKGDEVAIEGKLTNKNWVDKDGNKRYATEVVVNDFIKLKEYKFSQYEEVYRYNRPWARFNKRQVPKTGKAEVR